MRVFISDISNSFGLELIKILQQEDHEIVGSVNTKAQLGSIKKKIQEHPSSDKEDALKEPIALASDSAAMASLLKQSHVVIYSITEDPKGALDTLKALESNENEEENDITSKKYIAVSSVLTWSRNPVYANETKGHKEDDYKQRKPTRKYGEIKTVETQILSANRDELQTCIVAAGLVYGGAQTNFQYLFREAWLNPSKDLIVPSLNERHGDNLLPTINVYDLAQIVAKLATGTAFPKSYMVATDKTNHTLREISQAVSSYLGNGKLVDLSAEEADQLLIDEGDISSLQLNLVFDTIEPTAIDGLELETVLQFRDTGLVANIQKICEDYLTSFDLRPLRIVVLGPPRSGKTLLSEKLAKDYYLNHLTIEGVLNEFLQVPTDLPGLESLSTELEPYQGKNSWEIPTSSVLSLLRWKLSSASSRNQGYVLDGFPLNVDQATTLFDQTTAIESLNVEQQQITENENQEASEETKILVPLPPTTQPVRVQVPNRVILLDTKREICEQRARQLSEEEAERTQNTLSSFELRWKTFFDELDPLEMFFEKQMQLEILEMVVDEQAKTNVDDALIKRYIEREKKPFNFHPTKKEIELAYKKQVAEKEAQDAFLVQQQLEQEEKKNHEEQARLLAEKHRLECIQKEEAEILEARSKPLRTYLMETVLPALTEGMLEIIKVQPKDPVDYLAEFLFRKGKEM